MFEKQRFVCLLDNTLFDEKKKFTELIGILDPAKKSREFEAVLFENLVCT